MGAGDRRVSGVYVGAGRARIMDVGRILMLCFIEHSGKQATSDESPDEARRDTRNYTGGTQLLLLMQVGVRGESQMEPQPAGLDHQTSGTSSEASCLPAFPPPSPTTQAAARPHPAGCESLGAAGQARKEQLTREAGRPRGRARRPVTCCPYSATRVSCSKPPTAGTAATHTATSMIWPARCDIRFRDRQG